MAWTLFYHSTGSSGPALLFVGTSMLLTMLQSLHSCHFTVGTQDICSCYQQLLCYHLIVHLVQLSTPRFSWIPINHAYQSKCHSDVTTVHPDEMDQCVGVSLISDIQVDVIHIEWVADDFHTSEPVRVSHYLP